MWRLLISFEYKLLLLESKKNKTGYGGDWRICKRGPKKKWLLGDRIVYGEGFSKVWVWMRNSVTWWKKRLTVKLIILWYFDACIDLVRGKIIITSFKSIIYFIMIILGLVNLVYG